MKFIVNENIPVTLIVQLRKAGHDVLSVKESMRGEKDEIILEKAQSESRIIVTQDKDFGELAFERRLAAFCGVILFRVSGKTPDEDNQRMIRAIESRTDWPGHFSVITDTKIRMRPFFINNQA